MKIKTQWHLTESSTLLEKSLPLGHASDTTTFFNILKSIMGGSIICVPWAYGIVGWFPATLLLIFSAYLGWVTFIMFGQLSEQLKVQTVNEMVLRVWGKNCSMLFDLTFAALLMIIEVYFICSIADWFQSLTDSYYSRFTVITCLIWIFMFPACVIPNLRSASLASVIGSAALCYLILTICASTFYAPLESVSAVTDSSQYLSMFNVALPGFAGHINAPKFYAESKNRQNWVSIVSYVFVIILLSTTLFSFCAYILFGSDLQSNLLNNFPNDSVTANLLRYVMILNLICSSPMVLFALRETVDPHIRHSLISIPTLWRHLGLGVIFCVAMWVFSMQVPFIGLLNVVFLPLPNIIQTFILPCATLWKVTETSLFDKCWLLGIILVTTFMSFYGILQGINEYF